MRKLSAKPQRSENTKSSITLFSVISRLLALMLFAAGGAWLMFQMWLDGYWYFAAIILVITLIVTIIWTNPNLYPMRWMSPGLSLMILISVYPILYTVYISFTNFGTGNLLPKSEAIHILENRRFLPEHATTYEYALYQNSEGDYALLVRVQSSSEKSASVILTPNQTITESANGEISYIDQPPSEFLLAGRQDAYKLIARNKMLAAIANLRGVTFGDENYTVQIIGISSAAALEPQYEYDERTDTIFDRKGNLVYQADNERGVFVTKDGIQLDPGFVVGIGTSNYGRFFNNPTFRGPMILVFLWTVIYALVSTVVSFALGLLIAIAFGRNLPGKGIIKTLLIIPFAIPNVIAILVWRGLMNPINGLYGTALSSFFDQPINIFSDPVQIKIVLIVIEVWLSYPYFYLINSGALQAIPVDMYEAAELDGANWWHQFQYITLPLLLVGVGPLLIGSFMYNFNNFNLIYLFNEGGPPIVGSATPAGHTDILISYVYRLAFESGGQDYGYATAITVIIFFILLGVTLIQYRYMNVLEKVSENV